MAGFGKIAVIISIALIGIATYGPDSLICTAGSMDVGGKKGAGMAAGIINGMGSIGQMFSGFIVVAIPILKQATTHQLRYDYCFVSKSIRFFCNHPRADRCYNRDK